MSRREAIKCLVFGHKWAKSDLQIDWTETNEEMSNHECERCDASMHFTESELPA